MGGEVRPDREFVMPKIGIPSLCARAGELTSESVKSVTENWISKSMG